jgi:hypothetical protein
MPTIERSVAKILPLLWLCAPLSALAGGYFIPDENARDLALAQAEVAAQTGPEAAYQNASALAGQQGLAVSANLELLYNHTTWGDPALGTAALNPKVNTPPAVAVGWGSKLPGDMAYGVGVAFLTAGGGSLDWPAGWPGAQRVQSVSQQLYLAEGSVGLQPVSFFKIGASVLYYREVADLSQAIGFIDHNANAELSIAGDRVSYGLSGQLDVPGVPLSIAVDYKHKADLALSGNAHFQGVPPSFQALLQDQAVTENVTVPNDLFVGASYMLPRQIQVMAAWNLERWIVYPQDLFVGSAGFSVAVPRHYHNAYVFRGAAEWTGAFVEGLTLRLGALRSISPQPTDTISPSLTDGNSTALSVGAGYRILHGLRIDVGYQHAFFDPVTATGPEAFPGTYWTHVDLVSLGLSYRLDLAGAPR